MKKITCVVTSKMGIHARPASNIAAIARSYKCNIQIILRNRTANAKRIVEVMEMNIRFGDEIVMIIEGIDEMLAFEEFKKICNLL